MADQSIPPPPPEEGAARDNETMNMVAEPPISQEGWDVQNTGEEAAMLFYNGVAVGRLYGGCPISEMMRKLQA